MCIWSTSCYSLEFPITQLNILSDLFKIDWIQFDISILSRYHIHFNKRIFFFIIYFSYSHIEIYIYTKCQAFNYTTNYIKNNAVKQNELDSFLYIIKLMLFVLFFFVVVFFGVKYKMKTEQIMLNGLNTFFSGGGVFLEYYYRISWQMPINNFILGLLTEKKMIKLFHSFLFFLFFIYLFI